MAKLENLDLSYPPKHTNAAKMHVEILFVRNSETKQKASASQNTNPDSLKLVGRLGMPAR